MRVQCFRFGLLTNAKPLIRQTGKVQLGKTQSGSCEKQGHKTYVYINQQQIIPTMDQNMFMPKPARQMKYHVTTVVEA